MPILRPAVLGKLCQPAFGSIEAPCGASSVSWSKNLNSPVRPVNLKMFLQIEAPPVSSAPGQPGWDRRTPGHGNHAGLAHGSAFTCVASARTCLLDFASPRFGLPNRRSARSAAAFAGHWPAQPCGASHWLFISSTSEFSSDSVISSWSYLLWRVRLRGHDRVHPPVPRPGSSFPLCTKAKTPRIGRRRQPGSPQMILSIGVAAGRKPRQHPAM